MELFPDRFDFLIAAADADRPVRVELEAPLRGVTAYDYNADHRRLALGILYGRVILAQLDAAGSIVRPANVATHDFLIRSLAMSGDAWIVAAGSVGGVTMTTLNADLTVARHIRLKGHRGDVGLLRFSPGDRLLLTGGEESQLHVHAVGAERLVDLACTVAGRTFSDIERSRLADARLANLCRR